MEYLRCAVVGLGTFGSFHARVWSELPYTRLAAVCDRTQRGLPPWAHNTAYPGTPITARFWRSAPAKQCQWRRRIICTDRWRWMLPVRESMFW